MKLDILKHMPDLKGQIVDILEDALEEKGASIYNEDREDAIAEEGEDPDGLAIIYGSDYGIIGDVVENTIKNKYQGELITDNFIKVTIVNAIMDSFKEIISSSDKEFSLMDLNKLKESIQNTLKNWEIFA